jgi:cytochrome P450
MNRRFRRGWDRLDQAIYRIIEARWVDASEQNDALGALLLVEDDEEGGGGMTDRQIRDEALTLILAGHEMTAVALTWALYLLARHPEVEAELGAELKRVLNGRTPTAHDILDLHHTRIVLAESMRLYPPVYMIGRQALAEAT